MVTILDSGDFLADEPRFPPGSPTTLFTNRVTGAAAPAEMFSDDAPEASSLDLASAAIWRELSNLNRNTVSATVLDQYGNPYTRGVDVTATFSSRSGLTDETDIRKSNDRGLVYFSYDFGNTASMTEIVTLSATPTVDVSATVFWGKVGTVRDMTATRLLMPDPGTGALIVSSGTIAEAYPFGADDEFFVSGFADDGNDDGMPDTVLRRVSLEQFAEVLTVAFTPDTRISRADDPAGAQVQWEDYDLGRPNDRATVTLSNLVCEPPAGGNREPLTSTQPVPVIN